ncbi:hypothetical protein N7931_16795 [Catenovulum sp. 2E275]|uniref:transposase n=1 Tax=Catenovulum sp. 2E275 TaxID=2980497 RepID=UPI0021D379E2|nr:transposase [Catenovulum sp. 2E275]MCU4677283.1 hypothetical protein [Catenovulum sp. 2E275]
MAKPRSSLISLADTPFYHCISRCVRRSFLCGEDKVSGQCFDHRKLWLVERIKKLAAIFCIDIAAYAIMSNHYHLVLRVNTDLAKSLSDDDILLRWTTLYQPSFILSRYLAGRKPSQSEQLVLASLAKQYRERLTSISWFMRNLNEFVARQANFEDKCTGRFWEGRFKSQA